MNYRRNDSYILIGSPYLLRTDLGTENSSIAVMQSVLRHIASNGTQDGPSHIYGKSTSNQVIKLNYSKKLQYCML